MTKIYKKAPRKFMVTADHTFMGEIERKMCNEYSLESVVEELIQTYEEAPHVEIHLYELLDFE